MKEKKNYLWGSISRYVLELHWGIMSPGSRLGTERCKINCKDLSAFSLTVFIWAYYYVENKYITLNTTPNTIYTIQHIAYSSSVSTDTKIMCKDCICKAKFCTVASIRHATLMMTVVMMTTVVVVMITSTPWRLLQRSSNAAPALITLRWASWKQVSRSVSPLPRIAVHYSYFSYTSSSFISCGGEVPRVLIKPIKQEFLLRA